MPEFVNPNNYTVHLIGPDGQLVKVKAGGHKNLSEYFNKYCARGFIRLVTGAAVSPAPTPVRPVQARLHKTIKPVIEPVKPHIRPVLKSKIVQHRVGRVVGRPVNTDSTELLKTNLARNNYPISNNIGVGILSYNRAASLQRLIQSIVNNTDLRRTTIFISDDASTDSATNAYLDELARNPNLIVLRNQHRLGVAGNSNRLLRCLARFRYGLLLNDDVEIIGSNWEYFYPAALDRTGLHHLLYRQQGVYGAERGDAIAVAGLTLHKVVDKPHGAVLAFTQHFVQQVGYFDEQYGMYGMEHVDWSQRAWELGVQGPGFFDVAGSDRLFRINADPSAVDNRTQLLQDAKEIFANRVVRAVPLTPASAVPEIAYIIPIRNFERTKSILTVVNNIRAQRFPVVHIIMVEQDQASQIDLAAYQPINYYLVNAPENHLFNKSKAFNLGVSKAPCELVILHDADILAHGHYTGAVATILATHDACHVGNTVIYTSPEAMQTINATGIVDTAVKCERTVGYYEGGSLACTKRAFWAVGGFNEDYWGYGVEDCDFYARLSESSRWKEDRVFDFLHLWHSRVQGWVAHHEANKVLETSLKQKSIAERIQLQHQQLRRAGYGPHLEAT